MEVRIYHFRNKKQGVRRKIYEKMSAINHTITNCTRMPITYQDDSPLPTTDHRRSRTWNQATRTQSIKR